MCGRYRTGKPHEIDEHFQLPEPFPGGVHLNISPTDTAAIITNAEPHHWTTARWGLIPSSARDPSEIRHTINARIESLATSGAWRGPFRRRRCLVPADGFYEWTPIPGAKKKQPHLIGLRGWNPFAFAGLWNETSSSTGERVRSFAIITCPPDDFMRPIHDRMPLILPRASWTAWLDPEERTPDELVPVLTAIDAAMMQEEPCDDPRMLDAAVAR